MKFAGENQFHLFAATDPKDAAERMSNWLETLPSVESARPVFVTIAGKRYLGAEYVSITEAKSTERVVTEGPMKAGDELRSTRIMLLGPKPKHRRVNNVYRITNAVTPACEVCYEESNEWYIGGYYDQAESNEYHPQGRCWFLHHHKPMNFGYYKSWTIDKGNRYEPYPRLDTEIEYLDAA